MLKDSLRPFYAAIRDVPDFPRPGIVFKDITPLLLDGELFKQAITLMADAFADSNVNKVLAIESRGFLFGGPVATQLQVGLALARKSGKLPWKRRTVEYALEYGTDTIEIHTDAVHPGDRVLIVDDVLATGGTAEATQRIIREAGAEVAGIGILIELRFLGGRDRLGDTRLWRLLEYPHP